MNKFVTLKIKYYKLSPGYTMQCLLQTSLSKSPVQNLYIADMWYTIHANITHMY